MKRILLILIITIITQSANAQITRATLQASGLTCSMCNLSIKKGLEKLNFIDSIIPNIENASYELVFKKDILVDLREIKNAVERAGFSLAQLSFSINLKNIELTNHTFVLNGINYFIIENKPFTKVDDVVNLYVTDKGYLSEKKYKKFKSLNRQSENEVIINITPL